MATAPPEPHGTALPPPAPWRDLLPRAWVPDAVAAGLLAVVGFVEVGARTLGFVGLLVVLGAAVAVGLSRCAPGYALAVVWASAAVQVLAVRDLVVVEVVAALVVGYGTARHGTRPLVWVSGLSIPGGATLAAAWVVLRGSSVVFRFTGLGASLSFLSGGSLLVIGWFLVAALLGIPWVTGLAVRARSQADRSRVQQLAAEEARDRAEGERAAAQEIARLRAEQTRLARDVHDVVGHSLAVILVQAESATYLPDDDLARIRNTMTNIATSARRSLQDVRQVLSSTGQGPAPVGAAPTVDDLVGDLRAAGNDVRTEVVGEPWPLAPDEQTLVYRLAQEMLTNALKHGRRGAPVAVEQQWRGDLLLEVRNEVEPGVEPRDGGLGLAGMRRRVEEVGGRLAVRRRDDAGTVVFTATAWIPTRWPDQ